MQIKIIGEHPLARDESGRLRNRIATVFPRERTIVTRGVTHGEQRLVYAAVLNEQRLSAGRKKMTQDEEEAAWEPSVDLEIKEDDVILIRPDPQNMPLAFEADRLLQELLPADRIRYLHISHPRVRDAIKRRGELWRISPLPRSKAEMKRMIETSRIAIGGRPIYYYSAESGTRWLTCQELAGLADLDDKQLRQHLLEIQQFAGRRNLRGNPEVAFFMADPSFNHDVLERGDLAGLDPRQLRDALESLCQALAAAVPAAFRSDNPDDEQWRAAMYAALVLQPEGFVPEEALLGLSPEFFMHIDWLPGGRMEGGELIFDPAFEESRGGRTCDDKVRGFIFNFLREYDDLEYINVGSVVEPLARRRAQEGRRGVYIAELKQKGCERPIVRIIRMQKWDVIHYLDRCMGLGDAVVRSEEYTEYVLDRRMGCRQLGMIVPMRITARKVLERWNGMVIWSPYFERDYISGVATDKIAGAQLQDAAFALALARLLGEAAAPNIIVGRADDRGAPIFDDGDEVLLHAEDAGRMRIVVADPTGAFAAYQTDLCETIGRYVESVSSRRPHLPDAAAFADAYVGAFQQRFCQIQREYREHRHAFDTLFRDRPRDEAGSFAYRWECVLRRLDQADAPHLATLLRRAMPI